MNNPLYRDFRPILFIFVFVTAFCLTGKDWLMQKGVSRDLVIFGNMLLFGVSLAAYLINLRSIRSSNPQSAVRAMYGGFMIRFFVIALAAFIYIMIVKKQVNKPGLIVCAALYILYTLFETRALMRLAKQKKDG
ncbi:MAG: hypothetical protein ACO25B_09355 [Chitinophagaceae bacterium]